MWVHLFQFPSNGKAHSDPSGATQQLPTLMEGFNSLQTGRHIQTGPITDTQLDKILGFNSLQTGRHIQTGELKSEEEYYGSEFQFPSNGKAHSDSSVETKLLFL